MPADNRAWFAGVLFRQSLVIKGLTRTKFKSSTKLGSWWSRSEVSSRMGEVGLMKRTSRVACAIERFEHLWRDQLDDLRLIATKRRNNEGYATAFDMIGHARYSQDRRELGMPTQVRVLGPVATRPIDEAAKMDMK
ncbi:unnamed protein product [Protopolystoma xenopodis]|uniref:Uncharacterized protein n=1 Tax=Protopolystoma xenopodis TaxID=117903 RepID=A0A448X3T2_9PLAT|nr:unnamed protein product [Protopolystoma xenopodis]